MDSGSGPSSGRSPKVDALRTVAMLAVCVNHAVLASTMSLVQTPGSNAWNLVSIGVQSGAWVPSSTYGSLPLNLAVSFHVALLAFLGGYVTKYRSVMAKGFLQRRGHRLMTPYLAWLLIAGFIVNGFLPQGVFKTWLGGLLNPHSTGSLWFLYSFFVCQVALWLVLRLPNGKTLLMLSGLLAVLFAGLPALPLAKYGASTLWLYPFLVSGYLFARTEGLRTTMRPAFIPFASSAVFLVTFYLTWPQILPVQNWMYAGQVGAIGTIGYAILRFANALAAIAVLWRVIDFVSARALKPLAWAGRRTIGIYAIHPLLLGPLAGVGLGPLGIAASAYLGSLGATVAIERVPLLRVVLLGESPR